MADEGSAIISSDGHVYDAAIFADGVLFTARKPELSLIIIDEDRTDELDEVNKLINEMHDEFYKKIDMIVTLILG